MCTVDFERNAGEKTKTKNTRACSVSARTRKHARTHARWSLPSLSCRHATTLARCEKGCRLFSSQVNVLQLKHLWQITWSMFGFPKFYLFTEVAVRLFLRFTRSSIKFAFLFTRQTDMSEHRVGVFFKHSLNLAMGCRTGPSICFKWVNQLFSASHITSSSLHSIIW